MMRNVKLYPEPAPRPAWPAWILAVAAALVLCPRPVLAAEAPLVAVEAVQWPAWVERGGERRPLAAGEALQGQDRLATGTGGRALLRLADGSGVKLGENAQLELKGLSKGNDGILNAAVEVVRGAFRFTTGLFSGRLKQRSVNVTVATITAGIRGTDVWGKADDNRDLLCLLEGRITVSHPLAPAPVTMDQASSFYTADKGKAPGAIAFVDTAQITKWAAETEIAPGQGSARSGAPWQVLLARVDTQPAALAILDQATALGFPARIRPIRDGESTAYEIRIRHLASENEARALAANLGAALKLPDAKASR
jgi:hypothetical protein